MFRSLLLWDKLVLCVALIEPFRSSSCVWIPEAVEAVKINHWLPDLRRRVVLSSVKSRAPKRKRMR